MEPFKRTSEKCEQNYWVLYLILSQPASVSAGYKPKTKTVRQTFGFQKRIETNERKKKKKIMSSKNCRAQGRL